MADKKRASSKAIDFSSVRERGAHNPRRVEAGDYAAVITGVEDAVSKRDGAFQYVFTFKLMKYSQNTYPYYCKVVENQLWKLRNLLMAAGINVPKRRVSVDPNKLVGKRVGITLEDDEPYTNPDTGKTTVKSVIQAVFPISELAESELVGEVEREEEQGENEEYDYGVDEDEAPTPEVEKPKKKKNKKKTVDEHEELDLDDI